jgi:alkylation response protein AidB-like acyl-CoA dehydrogenase
MQIGLTEDQIQFRDVVSRFLTDKSPAGEVRRLMGSEEGYDAAVWRQLCEEVGLAGIHIPESYGGAGFGPVELGIVAEQMGRTLFCGPYFSSAVMASYALLDFASETHKEALLPEIASGATIATLVLDNLDAPQNVGQSITATETKDGHALNGSAAAVLDAHIADLLLVLASDGDGISLYCVRADASNMSVEPVEALDSTRKLSRVSFKETPAQWISEGSVVEMDKLWDQLCIVLAHEMIGGAQALLENTVDYTKMRVQFGRAIGSFQGLKHRCADLLVEVELAKAATHHAAQCLASSDGDVYAASMAKSMAADAYMSAARTAIQLRGGIGFTWENDTHMWFKRAKSSEVFLGSPHWHRERMVQLIEVNHAN